MLQARMALMPQNDFAPAMNCYGEGCTGGSQPQFIQTTPFYETPYFVGGGIFIFLIMIFVVFLMFRNRKDNKK